jgi:hypothetical protein
MPALDCLGVNSGTIRNVGLMNVNVAASSVGSYAGGLAGTNQGAIYASFSNGQVSGGAVVGGLVGFNWGSIDNAYASGAALNGIIDGGLVGEHFGQAAINNSYATAVAVRGLLGDWFGGTVTYSYWDVDNSGTGSSAAGNGSSRVNLQQGIPYGFSSNIWGGDASIPIYPYLLWQIPSGTTAVQISGNAFSNQTHLNPIVIAPVKGIVNATDLGQTIYTGADGYYEFVTNSTVVPTGSGVITYLPQNGNAASYFNNIGSFSLLPMTAGYLTMWNLTGGLTSMIGDMSAAGGSLIGAHGLPFSVGNANILNLTSGTNLDLQGLLGFAVDQSLTVNNLVLEANGHVTQTQPINVNDLSLLSDGNFNLTNAGNLISVVAASILRPQPVIPTIIRGSGRVSSNSIHPLVETSGGINVFSGSNLLLGTTDAISGIFTTGKGIVTTSQGLTIDLAITVEAEGFGQAPLIVRPDTPYPSPGPALVLTDGPTFTNNSGSAALDTPSSSWQVWSQNPASDNRGGEVYNFKQYDATYGVTAPAQSTGNGFFYTLAPVLTATFANVTKQYDATTAASINTESYALTGGAVDGDTATPTNAPASGTYANKNAGSDKTVTVTGLTVTATALDGAATVYGYTANGQNITSIITQAPVTVISSAANKIYDGTTTAVGSVALSGVIEGDTVSIASGVTYSFNDPNAATAKPVTVAGLTITGPDAGNYALTAAEGTTANITPASLYCSATPINRPYGTDNPIFTGTITGLVGGDALAAATTGSLLFTSSATHTTLLGAYPILGSGLTLTSGNYTLNEAAANSTALNIGQLLLSINNATTMAGEAPLYTLSYNGSGTLVIDLSSVLSNTQFQIIPTNSLLAGTYQVTVPTPARVLQGNSHSARGSSPSPPFPPEPCRPQLYLQLYLRLPRYLLPNLRRLHRFSIQSCFPPWPDPTSPICSKSATQRHLTGLRSCLIP